MPAIPVKERWWKTRATLDPRGDWSYLWANVTPLNAAWIGMESMNHLYKSDVVNWSGFAQRDPTICDLLEICPVCNKWDHQNATKPIDVPIMPTNKKGEVSPHHYRHAWMTLPFGTPIAVMHRKLFDIISEDFDDDILVGDVYVFGGDRIPDLVSVVDRANLPWRMKYNKSMFRHAGMEGFRPCHHCGRVQTSGWDGPSYIYTPEMPNRAPRVAWSNLLLSPETCTRAKFDDRNEWTKLTCNSVQESGDLLDPFPFPCAMYWDDLESAMKQRGINFPLRKVDIHPTERPGPWIKKRIESLGKDAAVVDRSLTHGDLDSGTLETMIFYLRVRALFEQKVAERIDHWDDGQLRAFLIEYHDASWRAGSYFPV